MLTQLSMRNFKSWKSLGPMRLAPITGLFGTNSSGKSGILQMLLLIKQSADTTDISQAINLGDENSLVSLGAFRDVAFAHNSKAPIEVDLQWRAEGLEPTASGQPRRTDDLRFTASFGETENGGAAVTRAALHLARITIKWSKVESTKQPYEVKTNRTDANGKSTESTLSWPSDSQSGSVSGTEASLINVGSSSSLTAPIALKGAQDTVQGWLEKVFYLGPLRHPPKRLYERRSYPISYIGRDGKGAIDLVLDRRKISNGSTIDQPGPTLEGNILRWLQELGLAHHFEITPLPGREDIFEVRIQESKDAAKVLLPDVGFGISQVLPIIVLCCSAPRNATIILEQPELHLHPAAQTALADLLIFTAIKRGVQVIFESHSEHLLRRIQRRIAEARLDAENAALYFCERGGAEGSKLRALEIDPSGSIKNWPKDFFGDEFGEMAAITEAALARKRAKPA